MIIPITSLWLPILISAALVFVASSVIHMALKYHNTDYGPVPNEDRVLDALRPFNIPPGDYMMPRPGGPDAMRSEEFKKKVEKGPVVMFTVLRPGGMSNMGPLLVQWFAYTLLVGIVAAYLAGRLLPEGADYLSVFRVTGTVTFACYSMALMQQSIWFSHNWPSTLKSMFDGLVYAMLTGGVFGWLWPS